MKLEFEGRTWQLELEDVTTRQGEAIQAYTGLSFLRWFDSITKTDDPGWLKSMRCLYWAMREQNPDSDPVPLADVDVAPLKLLSAFNDAAAAENPAPAEPDPTKPGDGPDAEPTPPPAPEDSPAG